MFKSAHLKIAATCVVIVTLLAGSAAAAPAAQRKTGPAPETRSWLMQVQQLVERHVEVGFFLTGGAKNLGPGTWLQPKLDPGDNPCPSCSIIPPGGSR